MFKCEMQNFPECFHAALERDDVEIEYSPWRGTWYLTKKSEIWIDDLATHAHAVEATQSHYLEEAHA